MSIPEAKVDRRAARREEPITDAEIVTKDLHTHKTPAVAAELPEKIKHVEVPTTIVSPEVNLSAQPKTAINRQEITQPSSTQRIHNLLIENESLMKLLTDAYVEIEKLKTALGAKK